VIGRVMTLALALSAFGLAFMSIGPGFAREELHFGARTTGFFLMAAGVGSLTGSLVTVLANLKATLKLFIIWCAGFALSLVALCLNPFAPAAFLCMVTFGFSSSVLSIAGQTIFQTESKPQLLGRVTSLWSLGGGLAAITALPIGVAGDLISLRVSFGFVSLLLLAMCILVGAGATPLRWLGARTHTPEAWEPLEGEAAG
jgi:MFS family permease